MPSEPVGNSPRPGERLGADGGDLRLGGEVWRRGLARCGKTRYPPCPHPPDLLLREEKGVRAKRVLPHALRKESRALPGSPTREPGSRSCSADTAAQPGLRPFQRTVDFERSADDLGRAFAVTHLFVEQADRLEQERV